MIRPSSLHTGRVPNEKPEHAMKITQVRNATLLIHYAGTRFLIDPMLATGGTLVMAIDYLVGLGARGQRETPVEGGAGCDLGVVGGIRGDRDGGQQVGQVDMAAHLAELTAPVEFGCDGDGICRIAVTVEVDDRLARALFGPGGIGLPGADRNQRYQRDPDP